MKIQSNINRLLSVIFILLLAGAFVFANPDPDTNHFNGWQIVGPGGGDIRSIAIDPREKNRLYITTLDSQVYTSGDAGKTWRLLVAFNRPQLALDNILVDIEDSNLLYVTGQRHKEPGGFFYSKDAGMTWKEAKDLKNEAIHSLAQSSKDPNILITGGIGKVFISYNRGEDWKKITDDKVAFINQIVDSANFDPRNSNTIYLGTTWRPYKSTDGGKTWKLISKGMIDDSDIFAIDIDPANPDHIVTSACSGIYESLNGGELWSKMQGIPSQSRRTKAIVRNPSGNGAIYAGTTEGFWMSADNGKTWALTSTREIEINSIAIHPEEPNKIYIATNNYGMMVSNDGGRNFSLFNGNFSSRYVLNIVSDLTIPNRVYAATNNTARGGGAVFVSNDGGQTWAPSMKNLPIFNVIPFSFLQDRQNPETIYLGTNKGLYRSLDRGKYWTLMAATKATKPTKKATKGKTVAKAKTTAPPPMGKKVAFLTEKVNALQYTSDGKNGILAATDKGLYRTFNMSTGWEKLTFGAGLDEQVFTVYSSTADSQTIWAGTVRSGIVVTRDGGLTWQQVAGVPSDLPINIIKSDVHSPNMIYAGTFETFYLSRDGGQNWTRRGGGLPGGNYNSIIINPNNPNEVLAASAAEGRGGVYQSLDAGNTWKQVDSKDLNLPTRRIWTMAFDPNNTNRILIGTHSAGIYRVERDASTGSTETGGRPRVATKEP